MGSGGSKSKKRGTFDVGDQGAKQSSKSNSAENPENTPSSPTDQGGSTTAAEQGKSTTDNREQPASESPMEKGEDYVEAVVAKASEFGNNE